MQAFSRSAALIGTHALTRLSHAHVAVFGLGGVGGFVVEALARSGVGELSLVEYDAIDISNLNRQIIATHSTVHRAKLDVMHQRILDINPAAKVNPYALRFDETQTLDVTPCDVVIDAMDDVRAKCALMQRCAPTNVPLLMSLGTARRLDPKALVWGDLERVQGDPLAK
jgi:tRNA A37 threonylcarbamoyladenosine dehydratase